MVKNINKFYGLNQVLKNISFEIEGNNFYCLLGHNGSGKTTLLNIIS